MMSPRRVGAARAAAVVVASSPSSTARGQGEGGGGDDGGDPGRLRPRRREVVRTRVEDMRAPVLSWAVTTAHECRAP